MDQPLDLSQRDMDRMSRIETEDCYRYGDNVVQNNFPLRHHSPVESPQMQHHSPVQSVCPPRYQSPVQNACPPRHQNNVQLPSLADHYVPYGMQPHHQNPIQYMPNYYPDYLLLDQNGGQLNKRSSFHDMRSGSLTHPKRRKTELFSQPISKSSSDNNLSVSQETTLSPKSGFFRPGFPMNSHEQNVNSSSADMYFKSTERHASLTSSDPTMHLIARNESPMTHQENVLNFQSSSNCSDSPARLSASSSCAGSPIAVDVPSPRSPTEEETEAQKERNKTIKYMERLPKKRISARNLSQESFKESSNESSQTKRHFSCTTVNQRNNINDTEEMIKFIPNDFSSQSSRDQSLLNGANVGTQPPSPDSRVELKEPRTKSPIDAKSLKKDMIREIEDEEMREKAGETKPSDSGFSSYLYSAKLRHRTNGDETNSGDAKMTALDYFISKTLSLRQDRPLKSRNQHIHQIIRGEKPGKLCLMDMVELQVEIGLA